MNDRSLFDSHVLSPATHRRSGDPVDFSPAPETLHLNPLRSRLAALPFAASATRLQPPLQLQLTFGFCSLPAATP